MKREFYVAYKEENPWEKSKPWAFIVKVHPESELGKKGIEASVWSGYRTKKAAQEAADAHRRMAEINGMI